MGPSTHERTPFLEFLKKKDLKFTSQREIIVNAACTRHRHFTAEQLFDEVRKKDAAISRATVYRTLSLLVEAQLLDANDFERGQTYYERKLGYRHHDHLICLDCGRIIEFTNPAIETLQDEVTRQHAFEPMYHRHQIFGKCSRCCQSKKH